jgi:hypothetical protein
MAFSLVRNSVPFSSFEWTEGAITVAVTSGGSDTATNARPDKLLAGDYSSAPFATIAAALAAIPKGLRHDVTITVGAGTFAGFSAHGFVGKGRLRMAGARALATVTTGVNTGLAGAGTTTTTMNKPGAAANWTADNLRGKFLVITAGAAASGDANFPTVRPIKSNTTTSLTFDPILDLEAGDTFEICDVATILTNADDTPYGLTVRSAFVQSYAKIEATFFKATEASGNYANLVMDCANVTMSGMHLLSSSGWASRMQGCTDVTLANSIIEGRLNPYASTSVNLTNIVLQSAGYIDSQYIVNHRLNADALECTGTAMLIRDCVSVLCGLNANDCAVVPMDLQNIHNFQIAGSMSGTNPTPTRGVLFSRGGQYIITGATIAGSESDEFEIEGRPGSYFELSGVNSGTYMSRGTFLHWGTGYTVLQTKFRVEGGEPGDDFDETILNNMVVGGIVKHYGAWQSLDPAYKEIDAYVDDEGGDNNQDTATVIGYRDTVVVGAENAFPNGAIRLLSSSEIAYAGGLIGSILNASPYPIRLYPPSGKKMYIDGITDNGTNAYVTIARGSRVVWLTRNDTDYNITIDDTQFGVRSASSSSFNNTITRMSGTNGKVIKSTNVVIEDGDQLYNYRAKRNRQTGSTYTLQATDSGQVLEFTQACTVTVPNDLFLDFCCTIVQVGVGAVTVVGDTGVDINNADAQFDTGGQWAMCSLYRTDDDTNQQFVFAGRTA